MRCLRCLTKELDLLLTNLLAKFAPIVQKKSLVIGN